MWDGSHACASIWDIDVPDYEKPETRAFLKDCYEQIKELALLPGQKQHQTLTTKIMLGVFGCVPAFDTFFTQTFHVSTFNPDALSKIHDFYCKHHGVINEYANKIKTLDFKTDPASNVRYTKAKLIDMVGFQQGKNKADAEKRKRKAEKRFSHRGNLLLKT